MLPYIPRIALRALTLVVRDHPVVPKRHNGVLQSNLFVTLILMEAFLSRRPGQTFAVLASDTLMPL